MGTTVNSGDRRWSAFFHIGAMLLVFFGYTPLNIIIPLGIMLFGPKKDTFMGNQIREVVRFQLITTITLYVATFAALIGSMYVPAIAAPALLVIVVFLLATYLIPIWGGIMALLGRPYAYPMMGSPRREAYVNRNNAPAESTADSPTADDDANTGS